AAAIVGERIEELIALLVRIRRAREEVRHAEADARAAAEGRAGRDAVRQLLFVIATRLEAEFVQHAIVEDAVRAADEEVGLYLVSAVHRLRDRDDRLRLDAVRRVPAVRVVAEA